jgi:GntR family transcriptional repressor for pyruvate dehydrogenase complex
MAEQFGASREAVRALQTKGRLDVQKCNGGGYPVKQADCEVLKSGLRTLALLGEFSVAQLAEVGLSIEPAVALLPAERSAPNDHAAPEALLDRRAEAFAAGEDFASLDLDFHRYVANATRNPLHVSLLDSPHD